MSDLEASRQAIQNRLKEIIPTALVEQVGGEMVAKISLKNQTIQLPIYRQVGRLNTAKLR